MEENYVTMYAKLTCNMGCMENYLNVDIDHGVYKLTESGEPYPVMCARDNVVKKNIPNFGKCCSPTNPDYDKQNLREKLMQNVKNLFNKDGKCACVPEINTPWYNANEANQLEGMGCLVQGSKIACAKGGIISIVMDASEGEKEE